MIRQLLTCLCLTAVLAISLLAIAAEKAENASSKPAAIQALHDYNVLVGGWRGIGQPKRSSQAGAWQERAESVWELKQQSHGIRWNVEAGKQWKSMLLGYDDSKKLYTLAVTLPDDSTRNYTGKLEEKNLIFDSAPDSNKEIHRVTMTVRNENRMTVLIEKRPEQQSFFSRVAEIGYQRDGTRLAVAGSSGPECVVTGGLGTIPVKYMGKTYYVCCTGCRDAFNDDPAGILAEYQKRKADEKKNK